MARRRSEQLSDGDAGQILEVQSSTEDGSSSPAPSLAPSPVPSLAPINYSHPVLYCRRCGFDLRGVDRSATCPRCGTPVEQTLAGDLLSKSDSHWVSRLARGLWLGAAGSALSLVFLFPQAMSTIQSRPVGPGEVDVLSWLLFIADIGLHVAGIWLLTAREPGVWRPPHEDALRVILRVGVIVHAALRVFAVRHFLSAPFGVSPWLISLSQVTAGIALVVVWWMYVRRILLRIPRPGLALAAVYTMIAAVIAPVARLWIPQLLLQLGAVEPALDLRRSDLAIWGERIAVACVVVVVALSARAVSEVFPFAHPVPTADE